VRGLSGDDAPAVRGQLGVGGKRPVGLEVQVALDPETEGSADGFELLKAHVAELGKA